VAIVVIEWNGAKDGVYYNFYKDFLKMQEYMLTLSNIYNFVGCEVKPPVCSNVAILSEYTHIHSLLCRFVENDEDPKFAFE
jgi:hypothetical protein